MMGSRVSLVEDGRRKEVLNNEEKMKTIYYQFMVFALLCCPILLQAQEKIKSSNTPIENFIFYTLVPILMMIGIIYYFMKSFNRKDASDKFEKKVLEELSSVINSEEKVKRKYKWLSILLTFIPAIGIGVLLDGGRNINMIYGVLLGFYIGLAVVYRVACKQIPFVKKHLNEESIKERLNTINNPEQKDQADSDAASH